MCWELERMHQCLSQFGSMETLTRDEYIFPEVLSLQSFSELSYSINIYSTYSYRISFKSDGIYNVQDWHHLKNIANSMYKHIVVHRASLVNHRLDFRWNSRRSMEVLPLRKPLEPLPCKPRISSILYFNLGTKRRLETTKLTTKLTTNFHSIIEK